MSESTATGSAKTTKTTKAGNPIKKTELPLDLAIRMQGLNTSTILHKALRNSEPGTKRGNTSKCWTLDRYTLFTAASMAIIEHKSAVEIHETLGDAMGTVSTRALSTWIKSIRKAYSSAHNQYLAEIETAEQFAFASGDLVALLGITFAGIVPKFIAWSKASDMQDMTTQDRHVQLRLLETCTSAAKVQSEARRSEAQTQSILSKLQHSAGVLGDENASTKSRSDAIKEVSAIIDELTGVGTGSGNSASHSVGGAV